MGDDPPARSSHIDKAKLILHTTPALRGTLSLAANLPNGLTSAWISKEAKRLVGIPGTMMHNLSVCRNLYPPQKRIAGIHK
jgi:hypothetical protein